MKGRASNIRENRQLAMVEMPDFLWQELKRFICLLAQGRLQRVEKTETVAVAGELPPMVCAAIPRELYTNFPAIILRNLVTSWLHLL